MSSRSSGLSKIRRIPVVPDRDVKLGWGAFSVVALLGVIVVSGASSLVWPFPRSADARSELDGGYN